MGFKCGIVGLPNVGKSTLFNALTSSSKAQAGNFPFCTIDPNIGIVAVSANPKYLEGQSRKLMVAIEKMHLAEIIDYQTKISKLSPEPS